MNRYNGFEENRIESGVKKVNDPFPANSLTEFIGMNWLFHKYNAISLPLFFIQC